MTTPTTAADTPLTMAILVLDQAVDDDGEDGGEVLPKHFGVRGSMLACVGGTVAGQTDVNGVGIGVLIGIEEVEGAGVSVEESDGEGVGECVGEYVREVKFELLPDPVLTSTTAAKSSFSSISSSHSL